MYWVDIEMAERAQLSAIQLTTMNSPRTASQPYRVPIIRPTRLSMPGRFSNRASRATNARIAPARWP